MRIKTAKRVSLLSILWILCMPGALPTRAEAGQAPATATSPRKAAPFDMSGYWTAVVTEDWRWRMVTPPKGDFASIPFNEEGIRVGNEWDPAKDSAARNECKAFGAAGLMRMPTRLRITWQGDATLKIETDHGQQTRLFRFSAVPSPAISEASTLQGNTVARWNPSALEATTNHLLPGYLRRNGAPYSGDAVVLEYWTKTSAFDEEWLTVTTVVRDPTYLRQDFITSSQFRKLRDGRQWTPLPCNRA